MRFVLPFVAALGLFTSSSALAQEHTAGAATLGVMLGVRSHQSASAPHATLPFGGDAIADLWADVGILRVGASLGVVPLTHEDATRSRVLLPFGPSVALAIHDEGTHLTFEPRVRAGVWAGATDFGLAMDVWASAGAWLGYDLSPNVFAAIGIDVWWVHAQYYQDEIDKTHHESDTFVFVSPGVSVSWRP